MLNIVGMGGGSGLPVLLKGLAELAARGLVSGAPAMAISAIVSVADNGGSSGALRRVFGIPAVGDLRNCLVALSNGDGSVAELFQHRFTSGEGLQGHSVGNLVLASLCELSGRLSTASQVIGDMLHLPGKVLPATDASCTLCAAFSDGTMVRGEAQIAAARKTIHRVWLEPEELSPGPGVLEALAAADGIVVGPGSLYTSILPNLLVPGVAAAIRQSPAMKIFICNLMTQRGETDCYTAADHLRVIESYLGPRTIDICVLNSGRPNGALLQRYLEIGSELVTDDDGDVAAMGVVPVRADLLEEASRIRHHSTALAGLVVALTRGALRARDIICGQPMVA